MSHLLIIKDAVGKEIARVPVTGGYSIQEVPLPKSELKKAEGDVKDVTVNDKGTGKSKV